MQVRKAPMKFVTLLTQGRCPASKTDSPLPLYVSDLSIFWSSDLLIFWSSDPNRTPLNASAPSDWSALLPQTENQDETRGVFFDPGRICSV